MATFGLTERQREKYFTLNKRRTGFGNLLKDNATGVRDFVQLFVFDTESRLIGDIVLDFENLVQENYSSDTIKLNVGQHLREFFNLSQGDYQVVYKFLRIVAGNIQSEVFYDPARDEIHNGQFRSEDVNGQIKYFTLVDDDDKSESTEREIFKKKLAYEIIETNQSRNELLITPDPHLTDRGGEISDILNRQLSLVNDDLIFSPLLSLNQQEKKITFDQSKFQQDSYVLRIPDNDLIGFTKSMNGNRIVFENFFKAQIPTHYKGQYLAIKSGTQDVGGKGKTNLWKNDIVPGSINEDTFIDKTDYIWQLNVGFPPRPGLEIMFMKKRKDLLVSKVVGDEVTDGQGYFIRELNKNFNINSISNLPKNIWQTTDRGPKDGDFSSIISGRLDYELEGTFPYSYNRQTDSDNVDLDGILKVNEPYALGDNLEEVFIDWETRIVDVIDKNTIRVKSNLKDSYFKLRQAGFKILSIGEDKYRTGKINELEFKNMFSETFYVEEKINDVNNYKTYLRLDNNNKDLYLITNTLKRDNGLLLKLQTSLAQNIELEDLKVDIVEEVLADYRDNITLIPKQYVSDTFLLPANFDGAKNDVIIQQTDYKSHNTLLTSDDEKNRKIERLLVSGSLLDVKPNISYQKTTTDLLQQDDDIGFGNFVHFSSAESRVINFRKKLRLIEGYTKDSSSLLSISSSLSKIQNIEKKRQRVIDSFTPYEDYLYFESSSYVSSSNGIFHDTAWPKMTSTKPYKLQHTTGSTGIAYYDNMINSASKYDFNNQNSLRFTLPEHIHQDTTNNPFLEFMDMVGEQFDEVWTYTKSLTDVNFRVSSISEGISKDVSKYYADALGIKLFDGNSLVGLSEYLLGEKDDGSSNETESEKLTEEIWKRILANLPFFIKTKGTERSLKGILNCYGIPSSVLRVREFGGPDTGTRVSYEIKRKFTYALDFKASQFIKTPWKTINDSYPDTTEFRFRSPYSVGSSGSMVLVQKSGSGAGSGGSWAISLQDNATTDNRGHLRFAISASDGTKRFVTSSALPFYNDDMWSVMLTRLSSSGVQHGDSDFPFTSSFQLTTKQYDSTRQRIIYEDTQSLTVTSSKYNAAFTSSGNIFLGGSGTGNHGTQFSGSMMEFRLWTEALSQSVFENHVRTPKAYNGNTTSSAYSNLVFRMPLDDNISLSSSNATLTASNIAHLKTYSNGISGSNINGFTGNFYKDLVDQEKVKIPNIGIRRNATKIRLENNSLPENAQLDPEQKQEVSSLDFAPLDSNKLGVYFSPTDVINEDIIYTFADFNFDNQIGDPRDEFEPFYRGLKQTRFDYFKRYRGAHNSFFDYLRILDFYDNSVFNVLEQFVPARAKTDFGNLIESNILERNKQIVNRKPSFTNRYFENANDFESGLKISRFISGSDDNNLNIFGEFPYYESVIAQSTGSVRATNRPTHVHLNQLNKRVADSVAYATASVTKGGTSVEFTEAVQPFISASRLSTTNRIRTFFYGSLSDSISAGFGASYGIPGNLFVISSSLDRTDLESLAENTIQEKLFYEGVKLNKNTSKDGKDPVEITFTAPTKLVTQEPGKSRLKTK